MTHFAIPAPEIEAVRRKASRSSFYAAMRLMPKVEREAMYAIYAFCRAVDDIADDGVGTRAERHGALDRWREDMARLYGGGAPGKAAFLAETIARYRPRLEDFLAVIDGMDMDVAADIVAPDLATLDLYCDRVASAAGRLSVKVFGMDEGPGFALAYHLGRALQLTNGLIRIVMMRSSLESSVRVARMAGTLQPKPMIIGMNDLPWRPSECMTLSMMKAARAMYPVSSKIEMMR